MNKLIALQRVVRTTNPDGYVDDWTTYATPRASVEPATPHALEMLTSVTITTPISHIVTLHFLADVQPADRVEFLDRHLYITGIQNPREESRWLVLACEERT